MRGDPAANADALVIVLPENSGGLGGTLRALLERLAERPRATLVLTPAGHASPPLEHPPTVPVTVGSGLDAHELAGQLNTMLAMRESLDTLHRSAVANRRSGQSAANRYMSQLRLASQVQRGFLPESLPRLGPVSFHVVFRPVDYVSGDIYDVHRLDEEHVGIALADASGHGIPAALLTVYIKRALRGKEIEHGTYRILEPDEVLSALNDDILDAHLADCAFVAAVYAVLNTRTLELSLRAAGPRIRCCGPRRGTCAYSTLPAGSWACCPIRILGSPRSSCSRATACCCIPTAWSVLWRRNARRVKCRNPCGAPRNGSPAAHGLRRSRLARA